MSVATTTLALRVRPLVESRPPAVSWRPAPLLSVPPDQPALDLTEAAAVDLAPPREPGVRAAVLRARWTVRPRPGLPDAGQWSGSLVVAVIQALLAQRPIGQLNRWLADDVLCVVSRQQRQHRSAPSRTVIPVGLCSVRVQHPHEEVAEVAARVAVGGSTIAVALRLEALGDRWLCTALEVDPRVLR
ncbi:MAG TPA: Rv3235 family protein [Propionibacteriaceae bacterium]|jgi:hypothetical protein|nr:Rv3235 family protein [Propionibacteriaceae bacterium]